MVISKKDIIFFNKKKIFIAGASGFIGTNLVNKLKKFNCKIFYHYHTAKPPKKMKGVTFIKADLTKQSNCKKVLKDIDIVFMCAANTSGAKIIQDKPLNHLTPNLIMNTLMLESAYINKIKKFIFISSNTVYPVTNFKVKESDTNYEYFEKYFIVGWMKRFTEIMCEMYSTKIKNKMVTIVIRPGNLYGPFDKFDWDKSKVIAALIRKFVEKHDPINVWGDGKDIKDFLYIDDFIDGLIKVTSRINKFEVLNLASSKQITIRRIIEILKKITNHNAKIEFDITKPTMIPKRMISIKKAKDQLAYKPIIDIEDGLTRTINWYKSNDN